MKKFYLVIVYIVITMALNLNISAQNDIYEFGGVVDEMPLFNNEHSAKSFRLYLQSQVEALSSSIPDSVSGRIIIQFWIDTTGTLVEPNVIEGINNDVDSLAVEIALNSPKWTIPRNRGKKMKVALTFPILINMETPTYIEPKLENKRKQRKVNK